MKSYYLLPFNKRSDLFESVEKLNVSLLRLAESLKKEGIEISVHRDGLISCDRGQFATVADFNSFMGRLKEETHNILIKEINVIENTDEATQ